MTSTATISIGEELDSDVAIDFEPSDVADQLVSDVIELLRQQGKTPVCVSATVTVDATVRGPKESGAGETDAPALKAGDHVAFVDCHGVERKGVVENPSVGIAKLVSIKFKSALYNIDTMFTVPPASVQLLPSEPKFNNGDKIVFDIEDRTRTGTVSMCLAGFANLEVRDDAGCYHSVPAKDVRPFPAVPSPNGTYSAPGFTATVEGVKACDEEAFKPGDEVVFSCADGLQRGTVLGGTAPAADGCVHIVCRAKNGCSRDDSYYLNISTKKIIHATPTAPCCSTPEPTADVERIAKEMHVADDREPRIWILLDASGREYYRVMARAALNVLNITPIEATAPKAAA